MRYDLTAMTKRAKKTRRKSITFRPIIAPATMASDLYAAAYAPVVKAWEAAAPRIIDQYERALAGLATDSAENVAVTIGAIESDLGSVFVRLRVALGAWAAKTEAWHRKKWRGTVLTATGVDIDTMIGAGSMRATVGASIERNVSLVRSVSEQTRAKISDEVFRGLSQRKPAREVAKAITEATGMARKRALNIAADQNTKLASALNDERRREAGLDTWEWLHSGKAHPRPEHLARNGKRYSDNPDDNAPPPEDRPGEWPFCGCTSRAVLSLDSEF